MGLTVDITKKMGHFTLESSFEIGNETLALLGASGCGKSMTLKCIAGIETPDSGSIVLDGKVLFDSKSKINLPPAKRQIGYLFQNYALFPNMTVEENIGAGILTKGPTKEAIIKEKIATFYLTGLEKKRPHQLSGGQQQRVAIARMLAATPKMLMLDEPFSALDTYLRWQLEQEILKVIGSYSKPTLFVSHNKDEVFRISHKIGVMEQGKLQPIRDKEHLFSDPKTLTGAMLTGCKNFSRIKTLSPNSFLAVDWDIILHTDHPLTDKHHVGIRSHGLTVALSSDQTDNTGVFRVLQVIDNTFTTVIILDNPTALPVPSSFSSNPLSTLPQKELRLELSKDLWHKIKSDTLKLHFPKESLLLLS